MKTKTLLIAAAALAVGVMTSQAQVYSQNIVGYVNAQTAAGQYVLLSNPLDDGTNTLNDLMPSAPIGTTALIWNGTGYTGSTKAPTGWSPNSGVPVGTGFFVRTATAITNTFTGSVVAASGSSVTNSLTGGVYALVGSAIPYADNLGGTNMNLAAPVGSTALIWNGTGYTGSTKTPTAWSPNPVISVGQGFFVRPSSTFNWVQTLNQ